MPTGLRHTGNRGRECGTKVAYSGELAAGNAATALAWTGRDSLQNLRAYPCTWCDDWHVGHPPNTTAA